MIDPIGSGLPATANSPAPRDMDRAAQQPPAAVQVTRSDEARSGGSSTSQQRGDTAEDSGARKSALEKALEAANSNLTAWSTGMRFDIDEDAQRVVISIVDSSTGEVLRTVPSDAVLRIAKMIVQLQGSGVDTKA